MHSPTKATIFTNFAFKSQDVLSLQVGNARFEHNSGKQLRARASKLGNMEIKEKENIGFHETRKEKPLFLGVFVFTSIKSINF